MVQQRRAQLVQPGVRQLHLRLDARDLRDPESGGPLGGVAQQRGLADTRSPRITSTPLWPVRASSSSRSSVARSIGPDTAAIAAPSLNQGSHPGLHRCEQAERGTVVPQPTHRVRHDPTLNYDVFINDPAAAGRRSCPTASRRLLADRKHADLRRAGRGAHRHTDDGGSGARLGDWVAEQGRTLTDIFVTHGHGDHWFAAGLLAERFGARIVASAGTIDQMRCNAAARPLLWDKVYTGIPASPVTAVTVPDNRFALEGHELVIVEVGSTDSDDTTVLHVPDLDLVVAGDVIYNGVHMYLAQTRRRLPALAARDRPRGVTRPRHIVSGHQNHELDDDADRLIAETREYLDDAEELLRTAANAVDFFIAKLDRYPDHLGRTVLWAGTQTLYGVREFTPARTREIAVASWL